MSSIREGKKDRRKGESLGVEAERPCAQVESFPAVPRRPKAAMDGRPSNKTSGDSPEIPARNVFRTIEQGTVSVPLDAGGRAKISGASPKTLDKKSGNV
jgi:hypothetical protein